jgi:hypothetical protein
MGYCGCYSPIYSFCLLSFRNAASFEEEDEDGSLCQDSVVVHEYDEANNSTDRVGHTDPSQTSKAQLLDCGKETGKDYQVQSLANSTALADFRKVYVRCPESRTVRDLWQEYAHGLHGQEPLREKEKRGKSGAKTQWIP